MIQRVSGRSGNMRTSFVDGYCMVVVRLKHASIRQGLATDAQAISRIVQGRGLETYHCSGPEASAA